MKARFTITVELEDTSDRAKKYDVRHQNRPDRAPTIELQVVAEHIRRQVNMAACYLISPTTSIKVYDEWPSVID